MTEQLIFIKWPAGARMRKMCLSAKESENSYSLGFHRKADECGILH